MGQGSDGIVKYQIPDDVSAGVYNIELFDISLSDKNFSGAEAIYAEGLSQTVKIGTQKFDEDSLTITAGSHVYTGKEILETFNITFNPTNETLVYGTDYTVEYSNNINAGTATAVITGMGEYAPTSVTKTFVINKTALTVTANPTIITFGQVPTHSRVTYNGFIEGEDESVLNGELVFDYTYSQFGDVELYEITASGLSATNYVITYVSGDLTVTEYELDV